MPNHLVSRDRNPRVARFSSRELGTLGQHKGTMKISGFWTVFEDLGSPLTQSGFRFAGKAWRMETDTFVLSFEAPSDKFGMSFQYRYLTVCLAHKGVIRPAGHRPWEDSTLDGGCPLNISPSKLKALVESKNRESVWHYEVDRSSDAYKAMCYQSVYYGGPDKWVLKDKDAPPDENRQFLAELLSEHGISSPSEEHMRREIVEATNHVGDYAHRWAEIMTPLETCSQIRRFGKGWWLASEWLESYEDIYPCN